MKLRIRHLAILTLCLASTLASASPSDAYKRCPTIENGLDRLACFDSYIDTGAISSGPVGIFQGDASDAVILDSRDRAVNNLPRLKEGLSSHEPNKILARMDENDISRLYMDANLSLKYPLLTPAVERLFDFTGIQMPAKPRLYLAFSSRFSQYIGSRDSSPVTARRYNPELFLRLWDNRAGYWDIGYGHESNGQQINSQAAFEQEEQNYRNNNQSEIFARDGISRGWDYVSVDWNKQWETGFLPNLEGFTTTHVELRRFLGNGLLQGAPEEYNDWERQGSEPKPRDEYAGLKFSLQYDLPPNFCVIACFDRVELSHQTGYADLFEHNTTSIELTTSVVGIPFHIWARSGYNSDLVDYFDYTNSWGIGVEFRR